MEWGKLAIIFLADK